MAKLSAPELEAGLAQASSTDEVTCYSIFHKALVCTGGVLWLARNAECFWLLDIVASYQLYPRFRREPHQTWHLKVNRGERKVRANGTRQPMAVVTCTDGGKGGKRRTLCRQEIPYTDFPLDEVTLYNVQQGSQWVLQLPSEY